MPASTRSRVRPPTPTGDHGSPPTIAAVPKPGDYWITAPAAARLLGLQLHTVYRLIDDGKLHAEQGAKTVWKRNGRVGERRSVRLRRQDVDDYLERARVRPGQLRHLYPSAAGR